MSLCSLSYLGGVLDRASEISCGSDAVTCPFTGWIITCKAMVQPDRCRNMRKPMTEWAIVGTTAAHHLRDPIRMIWNPPIGVRLVEEPTGGALERTWRKPPIRLSNPRVTSHQ